METTCKECKETFSLDLRNVYIGTDQHPPHRDVVVIMCPYCKKRNEI